MLFRSDSETLSLFTQAILSLAQISYENLTPNEQEIFETQLELILDNISGILRVTAEVSSFDFSNFLGLVDFWCNAELRKLDSTPSKFLQT